MRHMPTCDFGVVIKMTVTQGWEFAHRFSERIARFLPKNEQMSNSLKNERMSN